MDKKLLIYDTFNAKYLSFQDVAESFVSNDEFFQLTRNNSILLMGSRGCGKTTLLKMLTPAGLNYWNDIEAKEVKKALNFTAVYIPSDIQWKNQFNYLNQHLNGKESIVEILTQFLFASNIQIALCKTFNSVIGFGDYSGQEKMILEFEVCKALAHSWRISEDGVTPTFDDIEIKILEKVRMMNSFVKKRIFRNEITDIEKQLPDYVFDSFFDLVKIGCKVFEQKLKLKEDHKWALCFDELEIVPKFIQLELIKYLRSVDQKYLFKLTTTPLFNMENVEHEATQGNDFSTIKLWVYDEAGLVRWREFCSKLLSNRFRKAYNQETVNFESIFSKSSLDEIIKDELNELSASDKKSIGYNGRFMPGAAKESSMNFLFKRLIQLDDTTKEFLERRKINTLDPYSDDRIIQKSVFQKYKVDAIYRLIYKGRTRKTPSIHYGLPYIYDICDGNPRLVIGLIDEILQRSKFDFQEITTVSKQDQSRIIYDASEKYFNLIQNHPDSTIIVKNTETNLAIHLLDKIGEYMFDKLVKGRFSTIAPGIVGKRFRLSAFLTPKYKIPSRVHSEVKLSTLLSIEETKNQTTIEY
ncbi:MAG: hypothetical protein HYZ42_14310 [Bacteroidetes bacterium]|nr:hypothetical protein [Bacteroidota bacterium]